MLLRRLAGSRWSAGAKTLRAAALSWIYSTAEYCEPVWCRSAHARLIDSVLNDALRCVTGCLRSMATDHLPILSGIQPTELGATLPLAKRDTLDQDHILHIQLAGSLYVPQETLKSKPPFVHAARKLLNDLSELGIRVVWWTNYRWSAEYSKRTSVLHVFISRAGSRPLGMDLPRKSLVKLNCVRTGVGRFHLSMYKWGLASSSNCERGATDQTTDHAISTCPIHRASSGVAGLTVLDDDTRCWLDTITASI